MTVLDQPDRFRKPGKAAALLSIFLMFAWGSAPAQPAASAPDLLEHNDAVQQQRIFELRRPPRDCTGNSVDGYVCWEIYPVAWQTFNKQKKGIRLIVKVWVNDASHTFNQADLEFASDGKITALKNVPFQLGKYAYEGATATVNDGGLIHRLAVSSDAHATIDAKPPLTLKLSQEMLASINAVYQRYDSLEAVANGVDVLNGKIADVVKQMQLYEHQWQTEHLGQDTCNTVKCLTEKKSILNQLLKAGATIDGLLDQKIEVLGGKSVADGSSTDRDDAVKMQDTLRDSMRGAQLMLGDVNQKLARGK